MNTLSLLIRTALTCRLLLWFSSICLAQDRPYRQFNTQPVRAFTQKQYPEYTKKLEDLESRISVIAAKGDDKQVYQIPIIIHILETDGLKMPDADQVRAQLDILNQHFGRYTPQTKDFPNEGIEKYAAMGVDVGIQFYIPGQIANLPGIHSVRTSRKSWDIFNQIQDPKQGGVAPVDPEHVINIWIGELVGNNAGYAHLPGAPGELDGIVIDPDYFGNEKSTAKAPYNQGKTLVHLMGTYLGLYELWDEANPCKDDGVADTPLHSGPTSQVSTEKNHRQICFCPGAPLAMYINFMDNTDDSQLMLFTQGQKDRMRAILAPDGLRPTLVKR